MSSSGSSMQRQVLATATRIKLRELNSHEQRLRLHYDALLAAAQTSADALDDNAPEAKRARLETLYDGTKDLEIVHSKIHPNLDDVGALVRFAACDPWTTRQAVAAREAQLQREIRQRRSLWRHNKLLGALLHASLQEETVEQEPTAALEETDKSSVAKLSKDETQAQLETYFFTPAPGVDEDAVYNFLEHSVFHKRDSYSQEQWTRIETTLRSVRHALSDYSESFKRYERVRTHEVGLAVTALLRNNGAFTDDVVAFLKDVEANTTTQRELAHVLTIELGNLGEFQWSSDGVPVQFKRGMNGRWRCHVMEDAVTLLLFQYVGMKWSETVRSQFSRLLEALDDTSRQRIPPTSVDATRRELRGIFTLAALSEAGQVYDEGSGTQGADLKNASKQDLLRLLCAEARYQRVFSEDADPSLTAVTTDLAFFGPSVAHAAVRACLRFFGVDDAMLSVFSRYMAMPLAFPGFDAPRAMVRGLSVSRAMTMMLSETLLFVMDFAVKAETGIHLYRRHDDIIFYDADAEKVTTAWDRMQQWANVAGLRFNDDKSGAVTLQYGATTPPLAVPPSLPATPIQWGLVELQPDASVRILQDKVDAYAAELGDRLGAATTVFGWINVYNKYMRFFLQSFGSVSPVFGPTHVRDMTSTLQRIHRRVFPASNGDVTAYLRDRIAQSHGEFLGDNDLPAAWTQWPLELGGLGLFNPFLAVWSLNEALQTYLETHHTRADDPWPTDETQWPWREPFTTARDAMMTAYQSVVDSVERDGGRLTALLQQKKARDLFAYVKSDTITDASRGFGSVRWNYTDAKSNEAADWRLRTRAEYLDVASVLEAPELQRDFRACLMQVSEVAKAPSESEATKAAAHQLDDAGLSSVSYWQWLAMLTSESLMDEFGTVAFFSRELLPAQLIETIKKTSVAY